MASDLAMVFGLRTVGGDDEQLGRLEGGGHGLAGIDLALDDDAVHRRADLRVAEVGLGVLQVGLGLLDGRLRQVDLGLVGLGYADLAGTQLVGSSSYVGA